MDVKAISFDEFYYEEEELTLYVPEMYEVVLLQYYEMVSELLGEIKDAFLEDTIYLPLGLSQSLCKPSN